MPVKHEKVIPITKAGANLKRLANDHDENPAPSKI